MWHFAEPDPTRRSVLATYEAGARLLPTWNIRHFISIAQPGWKSGILREVACYYEKSFIDMRFLYPVLISVLSVQAFPDSLSGKCAQRNAAAAFANFREDAAASCALPNGMNPNEERRLRLYQIHTGERVDVVYRIGDQYVPEALAKLDSLLRDRRTGDVHHYDPRLFDLLSDLTAAVGRQDAEINVLCGYRSPWTNEFLRRTTTGVAKHSLHMEAEAIDIRLPGEKTSTLRRAALALHRGGVGYYQSLDFIHVDVGPVRRW